MSEILRNLAADWVSEKRAGPGLLLWKSSRQPLAVVERGMWRGRGFVLYLKNMSTGAS